METPTFIANSMSRLCLLLLCSVSVTALGGSLGVSKRSELLKSTQSLKLDLNSGVLVPPGDARIKELRSALKMPTQEDNEKGDTGKFDPLKGKEKVINTGSAEKDKEAQEKAAKDQKERAERLEKYQKELDDAAEAQNISRMAKATDAIQKELAAPDE